MQHSQSTIQSLAMVEVAAVFNHLNFLNHEKKSIISVNSIPKWGGVN